jgi:predicted adenylyl cyclase CyaB
VKPTLIETKAKCDHPEVIEAILLKNKARYIGIDHQVDIYFDVNNGRLKLRQGNIECHLIFYNRQNQAGPKQSDVVLYKPQDAENLKDILRAANGVKVVVDKQRKIFFIDNVKFHIDKVEGLGSFMEIEAIDKDNSIGTDRLHEQCKFYMTLLKVKEENLLTSSYSDMLLDKM